MLNPLFIFDRIACRDDLQVPGNSSDLLPVLMAHVIALKKHGVLLNGRAGSEISVVLATSLLDNLSLKHPSFRLGDDEGINAELYYGIHKLPRGSIAAVKEHYQAGLLAATENGELKRVLEQLVYLIEQTIVSNEKVLTQLGCAPGGVSEIADSQTQVGVSIPQNLMPLVPDVIADLVNSLYHEDVRFEARDLRNIDVLMQRLELARHSALGSIDPGLAEDIARTPMSRDLPGEELSLRQQLAKASGLDLDDFSHDETKGLEDVFEVGDDGRQFAYPPQLSKHMEGVYVINQEEADRICVLGLTIQQALRYHELVDRINELNDGERQELDILDRTIQEKEQEVFAEYRKTYGAEAPQGLPEDHWVKTGLLPYGEAVIDLNAATESPTAITVETLGKLLRTHVDPNTGVLQHEQHLIGKLVQIGLVTGDLRKTMEGLAAKNASAQALAAHTGQALPEVPVAFSAPADPQHWLFTLTSDQPPMVLRTPVAIHGRTALTTGILEGVRWALAKGYRDKLEFDQIAQLAIIGTLGFATRDGLARSATGTEIDNAPEIFNWAAIKPIEPPKVDTPNNTSPEQGTGGQQISEVQLANMMRGYNAFAVPAEEARRRQLPLVDVSDELRQHLGGRDLVAVPLTAIDSNVETLAKQVKGSAPKAAPATKPAKPKADTQAKTKAATKPQAASRPTRKPAAKPKP